MMKSFTGNYTEVLDRGLANLGMPVPVQDRDQYLAGIAHDEHRTQYFSHGPISDLKARLVDTTHLDNMDTPVYLFDQGGYSASILTRPYIFMTTNYSEHVSNSPDFSADFAVAYLNDEETPCGFSIAYVRDDRDSNIPEDQRKYLYVVGIIEGTHLAPDDRRVTWIVHPELRYEFHSGNEIEAFDDIADAHIPNLIRQRLKSEYLSRFIPDLFPQTIFSARGVQDFGNRLRSNHNMDNRDVKWAQINVLLRAVQDPSGDIAHSIEYRAVHERDFFLKENHNRLLQELFANIQNHITNDRHQALTTLALKLELLALNDEMNLSQELRAAIQETATQLHQYPSDEDVKRILSQTRGLLATASAGIDTHAIMADHHYKQIALQKTYPKTEIQQPERPRKLDQTFGRRNLYMIILGSLALLMAIGIALTFSGVLAPIGLAVTAGSASLAIAAAVFSLSVLLLAGAKIIYNQHKYKKAQKLDAKDNFEFLRSQTNVAKRDLAMADLNESTKLKAPVIALDFILEEAGIEITHEDSRPNAPVSQDPVSPESYTFGLRRQSSTSPTLPNAAEDHLTSVESESRRIEL